MMEIEEYQDPVNFLNRIQRFLERDEATNNLLLGILFHLVKKPPCGEPEKKPFLALTHSSGCIYFVMVMTPPYNIVVYGEGENVTTATEDSVSFLLKKGIPIPGVIGPRKIAVQFANSWAAKTGDKIRVQMKQMIYRLDNVNELEMSPGEMSRAVTKHTELVAKWMEAFSKVTSERLGPDTALKKAQAAIKDSSAYLWIDKLPVSIAMKARATRNGVAIAGVYTPPEYRNRGYATSCVASLSKLLLRSGYSFCSLYTDLSNPTSNSIYRKIGYKPVRESIVYSFNNTPMN